jgi:Peptidase family M28
MKIIFTLLFTGFTGLFSFAQQINKTINAKEATRIISVLASDDMEGRKPFTPAIDQAAQFIANEFKASGLKYFDSLTGYQQKFTMYSGNQQSASGVINNKPVDANNILSFSTTSSLIITQDSDYAKVVIDSSANFFKEAFGVLNSHKKSIVFVRPEHLKLFQRFKGFNRETFEQEAPVVFVITADDPASYRFEINSDASIQSLANVIGVLPGKSKKDEYVVFSAHYDHLGIGKPDEKGDSIYNGANDDASGTTAVIMLARYFSKLRDNERTLVFVTFTAEETGGYGSQYFSKQIDPNKVVAMFNIEMIGTDSKWGNNSAYITGYEKSDFGKILQSNLSGSKFTFQPDPYPQENLFYRSDNATLASLGVPAHTISTSKMDNEPNYHKQSDEVSTLDLNNMAEIIKSIALSSKDIISGKETPARIPERVN